MTDAELRIVEFLRTSDATRPADLPDWLLALLGGDGQEELSHELITAASLVRRPYSPRWRLHPRLRSTIRVRPAARASRRSDRSKARSA
jgi:hypothetical protein